MRAKSAAILIFLAMAACLSIGANAGEGDGVLHVYTWEGYFAPETVRLFEEKHKCTVDFEFYDSNETMVQTLLSGGGYDIMTPAPNAAALLYREGTLRDIDHTLIPNLKHIDKKTACLAQDPEMRYSVPYTVTVTGVGYNRTKVADDAIGGWNVFDDARLAKKMTMLNDLRETVGAGLKHLGYSINSVSPDEVRAAGLTVRKWKRNIEAFEVDRAKEGLKSGRLAAIQAYNGDVALIIAENPDIAFYVPAEGSALNADDFVISSDAPHPRLAHAFINHYLDPEIAAMNMKGIYYVMPNPEALNRLGPELKNNPAFNISPDVLSKCEPILNLGEKESMYDEVWEEILLAD